VAKVIKTNIVIDGQRCRSIEDVQENFNLLDLMDEVASGRLHKWATSRKFTDIAEKLENIEPSNSPQYIAKEVCVLFDVHMSPEDMNNELTLRNIEDDLKSKKVSRDEARDIKKELGKDKQELEVYELKIEGLETTIKGLEEALNDMFIECEDDENIVKNLAENKSTPAFILEKIVDINDSMIDCYLAENPRAPAHVLAKIIDRGGRDVIEMAYDNPNIAIDMLEHFIDSDVWQFRSSLAAHPDTSPEHLKILSEDEENYVRNSVAKNIRTPKDTLSILVNDDDIFTQRGAIINTNTPRGVIESLEKNSSIEDALNFVLGNAKEKEKARRIVTKKGMIGRYC